jgi:hypothetical protein
MTGFARTGQTNENLIRGKRRENGNEFQRKMKQN